MRKLTNEYSLCPYVVLTMFFASHASLNSF